MSLFEYTNKRLEKLKECKSFADLDIQERELQHLLRNDFSVISEDVLVIAEEYSDWDDSRRRIDLLGVDTNGNLVVVELKRSEDGGEMDLQALRYAALVSTLTFDRAVSAFSRFLRNKKSSEGQRYDSADETPEYLNNTDEDNEDDAARTILRGHLKESDEGQFAQSVRIFLISADFSRELTTSVLWLIDQGIDIQCYRIQPYVLDTRKLMAIQQIIPLPEASEYQVKVREQSRKRRERQTSGADKTRYDLCIGGKEFPNQFKNRAMLQTLKHLANNVDSIENIAEHINRGFNNLVISVDGSISDEEEFIELAEEQRKNDGAISKDPRFFKRFYIDGEHFVIENERTYAFTNQWRDTEFWLETMTSLQSAYPSENIQFSPAKNTQLDTNNEEGPDPLDDPVQD